jgi:hypothetical protein
MPVFLKAADGVAEPCRGDLFVISGKPGQALVQQAQPHRSLTRVGVNKAPGDRVGAERFKYLPIGVCQSSRSFP